MEKQRYKLPSSKYSTLLSYQAPQASKIFIDIVKKEGIMPNDIRNIIDATSHIGGDTIHLSQIYPHANVLAIDIDPDAISCLIKNIQESGNHIKHRIKVMCCDSIEYLNSLAVPVDIIYFDPPWGGHSYADKKEIDLYLSNLSISNIINGLFRGEPITKIAVLKVPKNFSVSKFICSLRVSVKIDIWSIIKPQKDDSIAYNLLSIVNNC